MGGIAGEREGNAGRGRAGRGAGGHRHCAVAPRRAPEKSHPRARRPAASSPPGDERRGEPREPEEPGDRRARRRPSDPPVSPSPRCGSPCPPCPPCPPCSNQVHRGFCCSRSPARAAIAAGEWLQAALALSIENFFEEIPRAPAAIADGSAVSTDRSGVTSEPGAVHVLRIERCVRVSAPYPRRLGQRTEAAEARIPRVYPKATADHAGHHTVQHNASEYARTDKATGLRVHTNTAEGSHSLLRRAINGTWHRISEKHMHRYLAHCDFLWNTRRMSDGERVLELVRSCEGKRLFYRQPLTQS
ncbi:MAG TPA: transposase [Longimicrobium sp.]|nr:transposase [Longimicrobium sp.]